MSRAICSAMRQEMMIEWSWTSGEECGFSSGEKESNWNKL